jgi:hypothetical protein
MSQGLVGVHSLLIAEKPSLALSLLCVWEISESCRDFSVLVSHRSFEYCLCFISCP